MVATMMVTWDMWQLQEETRKDVTLSVIGGFIKNIAMFTTLKLLENVLYIRLSLVSTAVEYSVKLTMYTYLSNMTYPNRLLW